MANRMRVFAVIGSVLSCVAALAAWAFIGFNQHYFPEKGIVPQYVEVAVWSALALYLAMVAHFGNFNCGVRVGVIAQTTNLGLLLAQGEGL